MNIAKEVVILPLKTFFFGKDYVGLAVFGESKNLLPLIQYNFFHSHPPTSRSIADGSGGKMLETYTEQTG